MSPPPKPTIRILLVDDLKDNLLALEWLLKRDDVEIYTARSGTGALELMVPHDFALAIIDVQMPGMSGFELAELMRGANKTKGIPIIFVTATAKTQSFSFKGYESGAVDFLHKPLDTHAVKNKVNIFIELYKQKLELKRQLETITQSKIAQEALMEKLESSQTELEQAVQLREEFMSIASHELKTPLTSLRLQSQLRLRTLKKLGASSFTAERLKKLFTGDDKQLERVTHLVDDMLDISRIRTGKLSICPEKFDLSELVQSLVERTTEQLEEAGCKTVTEFKGPVIGTWDQFRMEQVVMNLLTNAMRYGAGGAISIRVSKDGYSASLSIRDQGCGIALENHGRIFEKFERAGASTNVQGLGLGLYIVKELVTAHHGLIRVESELGKGSTFIVELPLHYEFKESVAPLPRGLVAPEAGTFQCGT